MVRFILQQIKITGNKCFGKWFAKNVVEETVDLDALSEHMSTHNSPYSKGVIKGLLTDMVDCIQELTLEGIAVKIDDLAIFCVGIKSTGAESAEQFSAQENITGYKLRARATGNYRSNALKQVATIKEMDDYDGKLSA
jgi:hypothetical protein